MRQFLNTRIVARGGRLAAALLFLLQPAGSGSLGAAEGSAHLKNITYEKGTLSVQLDRMVPYKVFSLSKPPRLVLELSQTIHGDKPYEATVEDGVLQRIRSAQFQTTPDKVTRLVLDMPRLLPYKAREAGDSIILEFTGSEAAAAPAAPPSEAANAAHAEGIQPTHKQAGAPKAAAPALSGKAEASLTATAPAETPEKPKKAAPRSKDLLAALPRHPVTIDFDEADLRDVLRVLSEMSGINMIHGSELRGFVTIHLDQVPFNEAFDTILIMQGLVAQQMGENVLRIITPETLTSDRAKSVTFYKTFTLNYAKAADVVTHLSSVRISPNAKATVDQRSNSLIVTDTPEGLAAAERLIAELDKKPQQVMIETRMVEVGLTDSMDLGIQWEMASLNQGRSKTQVIGIRETKTTGTTDADAGSVGFINGSGSLSNPSPIAAATPVAALGPGERGTGVNLPGPQNAAITFGFINNTDILTATLNALSQKGLTKILSSPKVITVNNQEARILVGSRIPFQTTTVSGSGLATQSVTFQDVGIILTVTPTINSDERVRLRLAPEVSFPGANTPGLGPTINTRRAETEVIIRDGETLVVGGLIDEQTLQSAQKVPLLGDIPVLGVFFRSSSNTKRRTELLVFVTPRILRD